MQAREFLQKILPSEGFYCLARPHQKGYFLHRTFSDLDKMVRVSQEMDAMEHDVYFCIASLKQERVYDPTKNNGSGGHRYRTKANIHQLKSAFFEVDVLRPDEMEGATEEDLERKYSSKDEALQDLKRFCKALDWPLPSLVSSGWGYHIYWPLTEPVKPSDYEVFIKKMKLAAKKLEFKLDISAADISRVFRVPGTRNHKRRYSKQKVEVLKMMPEVGFDDLTSKLDAYLQGQHVDTSGIVPRTHLPDYLNFGDSNLDDIQEPLKLRPIVENCGAIRECIDMKADVSYHHWYHTLQVVRHCENGEALAHKISALGKDYDQSETDKMLRSLTEKGIPPTLCKTFANDSTACQACPHWGKINTPASLGRDTKKLREEIKLAMVQGSGKIPEPPFPYKMSKDSGITITQRDKEGNQFEETIFPYEVKPVKRLFSEREHKEITLWQAHTPSDGTQDIELPSSALYDKRAFSIALADAGIYSDLSRVDALRGYMVSYTQEVQKLLPKEYMYSRMGWRDDQKFVLGSQIYASGGVFPCSFERTGRVADAVHSSGSLDEWREIMTFFEGEEYAGHQLAIGAGFGSILMPLTGILGGIINIMGRSGEGKSTVQKVINSIWGHPTRMMLPAEARSSTYNAKISFINMMNNLPVCAEEITNASIDEVGSLAYAITQGSEKWRADIKGSIRESQGGWCTIMVSSSNTSLHEKLHNQQGASAKALRIFEYYLPKTTTHSIIEYQQGVDLPLLNHYGTAGPEYLRYVIANIDRAKALVQKFTSDMYYGLSLKPEERVWAAVLACSITGLQLARELDLHKFNLEDVRLFAFNQTKYMRKAVRDMSPTTAEILTNYLNENIRNMLVIESTGSDQAASTTSYVIQKPYGSLDIRYEVDSEHILISQQAFREWCAENSVMYREVLRDAEHLSIVINSSGKRTLSAGTDINTGRVRCIVINAAAPSFSGALVGVQKNLRSVIPNTGKIGAQI